MDEKKNTSHSHQKKSLAQYIQQGVSYIQENPIPTMRHLACMALCLNMTYASAQLEAPSDDINPTNLNNQPQLLEGGYLNTAGFTFSSQMDENFLQLRDAAKKGDVSTSQMLAENLTNYDMPAYVEYYRLSAMMRSQEGFPAQAVREYLYRYPNQPISDRMRTEYLLHLGKMQDYANFMPEYLKWVQRDNDQVECYRLLAELSSEKFEADRVKTQAFQYLSEPAKYGEAGIALVKELVNKQIISADQAKLFAITAAHKKQRTYAQRLFNVIGIESEYKTDLFKIIDLTAKSPMESADFLEQARNKQTVDVAEYAMISGLIGESLAKNLNDAAKTYYLNSAIKGLYTLTPSGYEWQVRNALKQKDWRWVQIAIDQMPGFVRKTDNAMNHPSNMWEYWYAKSLMAQGLKTQADQLLQKVTQNANFYGALATEDLGQLITMPEVYQPKKERVAEMSKRRSLQQAKRLVDLGLREEGRREWNWEARLMEDQDLINAAQLAMQMELTDRAIYTADRTKNIHNFELRYPMPLKDVLQNAADTAQVDLGFVYGLTRQESRFIKAARSGVGASGLMQVMPATGAWVAKRIGMDWPSNRQEAQAKLSDINTNTVLGAYYVKLLLQDLDNNLPLVAAGYNAGPGRPKRWRTQFNQPVEAAIFIENIPFNETRDYVKNVIANTVYYRARLQGNNPQSIKNLLGEINFSGAINTELP
jgi:soluble lytic murein transglycosylase